MESAPKDGTRILVWCRHDNWQYADADDRDEWEGPVVARWIEHNGGGWTWHGHAGVFMGWQPITQSPPPVSP